MYPPVLELFEHEGRSAPSNTRADQQRIPSRNPDSEAVSPALC